MSQLKPKQGKTKNNNTVHDPLKVGDKIQTQMHSVFKKRSVTLGAPHDSRQQHTKPSEHSCLSEDTKRQEGSGQTATRLKASFCLRELCCQTLQRINSYLNTNPTE